MVQKSDFQTSFEKFKNLVDERLEELVPKNSLVSEAMAYSLNIGGKRIRPIVMLAFCGLCGFDLSNEKKMKTALDLACALEMIHTYSLIHDDLPCMDDDDLRRGNPACHIEFGESTALLAGDGLLTFSFELMSELNLAPETKIQIINLASKAVGYQGMILGQELDINNINNNIVGIEELDKINSLKTGNLLKVAAMLGCVVAGSGQNQIQIAEQYGSEIGLAFQIRDDVLDVVGSADLIGKPVGSDEQNKKVTYASLIGIDSCKKKIRELAEDAKKKISCAFGNSEDFFKNFVFDLTDFLLEQNFD